VSLFHALGLLVTLVALFGYLNHRFVRLPDVIGVTAIGLIVSIAVVGYGAFEPAVSEWARHAIEGVEFEAVVFHGVLGMLLFAGSLHIDINDIARERWLILLLATVGVVISTVVIGVTLHYAVMLFGIDLPLIYCLLFGALISPTDPIAVLGILKTIGVSKGLRTRITGESLFNDGTGVVLFLTLVGVAVGDHAISFSGIAWLLVAEVIGGVLVGLALGWLGYFFLKGLDSYALEILITLSIATAGYAVAELLHTSAPIAVVIAGLFIGNHGKQFAMSETTREHLFTFWELTDELLNLLLFGLMGLEVIALALEPRDFGPGLLAIPIVLFARLISVGTPILALHRFRGFDANTAKIMTWASLRGAISVALALSLPNFPGRDVIVGATYVVVIFSILVQAPTVGYLVRRLGQSTAKS